MSTLGSQTIHEVEISIPRFGAWRADVTLTRGAAPVMGAATLTVGDLELQGSVLRSGLDAADRPRAVVVGAPGWERALAKPLSYQSDAGVRLKTVLKDLAALAGEQLEQPTDADLGSHFAVPASRDGEAVRLRTVLASLRRSGKLEPWRVDPDGVTRFGERVGVAVTARATELRRNAGLGLVVLGIDSPKSFLPGDLIEELPIRRVVFHETAGKLEALVWQ